MKLIAAAGVALVGMLGVAGGASAADLVRITPSGLFQSDVSHMASPPGDKRIFLAERGNSNNGRASIRILRDGNALAEPFLTINNVDLRSERGLMSIAFPPDYGESGLFYLFWIPDGPDTLNPSGKSGDIRIVEYRRSTTNPDKALPGSARLVFTTPHSAWNHNGGWLEFGPDGYLYFSIGDNAQRANAQDLGNFYGKVMRIDPTDPPGAATYKVPADNPFASTPGARDEIWAYGLRNPYRASFSPDGRMLIADVGEGTYEEINSGDFRGRNLGWPECEGFCDPRNSAFVDPLFAYNHNGSDGFGGGCAVIGGHVVEDPSLTGLTGRYIYSDYCGGDIRSLDLDAADGDYRSTGLSAFGNPVAFAKDAAGCSYLLQTRGGEDFGGVFRLVADGTGTAACPYQPEPPPLPSVTYRSFIPKRAIVGRRLAASAKCSIRCTATIRAKFRITRNRKLKKPIRFQPKKTRVKLGAKVKRKLAVKVPVRRVKQMRKAIRNGSRVTAVVRVAMTGVDGSGGSGQKTVRLFLKRR